MNPSTLLIGYTDSNLPVWQDEGGEPFIVVQRHHITVTDFQPLANPIRYGDIQSQ